MKQSLKLLTRNCCDDLLSFPQKRTLRNGYDLNQFPEDYLSWLNIPTSSFIDEAISLSPRVEDDLNSSITIFNELKHLDRVQANDKRLWVGLTHGRFFKYTKDRWMKNVAYSDDAIISRFHFEGAALEARMRNSIARLWWAAKLTYDESRNDPFELTRLLWEKQDLFQNIVERSYGTYENVVKGFLETYQSNKHLSEKQLRSLYTGLNAIGGVKVLSLLSKEEVGDELKRVAGYAGFPLT